MKRLLVVLLLTLLTACAVYFLLRTKPETSRVGVPDLLSFAPPGVSGVAYVDAQSIRSSRFWRSTIALFPEEQRDPEYRKFVTETGFDYERDLDRVAAYFFSPGSPHTSPVFLAVGRFDESKLNAYAHAEGEELTVNRVRIFKIRSKNKPVLFSLLDKDQILLTESDSTDDLEFVASMAQRHSSQSPLSKDIRDRIARVSGAGAFSVMEIERTSGSSGTPGWLSRQTRDLQGSMQWLTLAARPEGDRLKVQLEAESDGVFKAMQLGLLLDGFKIMTKSALRNPETKTDLSRQEAEALLHLLEETSTTRDGNRLQVRFELTQDLVRLFVEKGKKQSRGKNQSAEDPPRK